MQSSLEGSVQERWADDATMTTRELKSDIELTRRAGLRSWKRMKLLRWFVAKCMHLTAAVCGVEGFNSLVVSMPIMDVVPVMSVTLAVSFPSRFSS